MNRDLLCCDGTFMAQKKAEQLARDLTLSDDDGWHYRAEGNSIVARVAVYDAAWIFLGYL